MDDLRKKLNDFRSERDLTIQDLSILIKRHPLTIWKFIHGKTKPHETTLYKIKKLLGEQ